MRADGPSEIVRRPAKLPGLRGLAASCLGQLRKTVEKSGDRRKTARARLDSRVCRWTSGIRRLREGGRSRSWCRAVPAVDTCSAGRLGDGWAEIEDPPRTDGIARDRTGDRAEERHRGWDDHAILVAAGVHAVGGRMKLNREEERDRREAHNQTD